MSENLENNMPAEEEIQSVGQPEEAAAVAAEADSELELNDPEATDTEVDLGELDAAEEEEDVEANMTMGEKLKVLLMKPLYSSIIKWSFIGLGLVGLILYLLRSEGMAKAFAGVSGGIASFFSLFPISMAEILIFAAALGILAYLAFIVVRTFQVKGAFHKGGLWVQFGYSLIAVAAVFALLSSLCYGIFTYRDSLNKVTGGAYSNGKVTNYSFSQAMLYLIDGVNNSLADGMDSIFFAKSGASKYANKGRSTDAIAEKVSEAFDNAAQDIPTLKGKHLKAKSLLLSSVYSSNHIVSVYSPFTGELLVNDEYPEVVIPYQIAKTMATQRGYTNDGDSSFIAFIVCTRYSDDPYLNYSGYFNAYLEFSSKFYAENGKNLHLYMANALKESAKKEYVNLVKKMDALYGVNSDIEFVAAGEKLSADQYRDVAKLMLYEFRQMVGEGAIQIDDTETKSYGRFCNYITNAYLLDSDFRSDMEYVYSEYHPGASSY